jgi:hypothetical protein
MRQFAALVAVLGACTLLAETASAQEQLWLKDRQYREGMGFLVGDFELHPGLGAEFGYDSNYFRRDKGEDPVGSLRIRVSPSFSVSTLGPQRRGDDAPPPTVNFRADLAASYNEFIPISGSDAGKEQMKGQRNIMGDLGLNLDILPERTWSGRLYAGVTRSVMPTNEGDTSSSFNRDIPRVGGEIIWAPGGGMLDWRLGYGFEGTFFESGDYGNLNVLRNTVSTRGRWRFMPRTALMFDLRSGFFIYPKAGEVKTNSFPLHARAGLNGLFTPSFGLLALVGYGTSFYQGVAVGGGEEPQDFDSIIGQAELKFYFTPVTDADPMKAQAALSSLAAGFVRDFDDSYVGSYLEKDRGYLKFSYLFGGLFLAAVEGGVGAVRFPMVPQYGRPNPWTDLAVDASVLAEFRIKDMWGINATFQYDGFFSKVQLLPRSGVGLDSLAYQDISAFIGARWFM